MTSVGPEAPRERAEPVVVFLSSTVVLMAVALAWHISDLHYAGLPIHQWSLDRTTALFAIPASMAGLVTLGIRIADTRLARISNRRPDTRDASKIPVLVQAALAAFAGSLLSWIAYLSGAVLGLDAAHRWIPHVLLGGPELVVMYYCAHRFIDMDMLRPDVRPWFLSAMLTLGSAGMATAKFFSIQPGPNNPSDNSSVTVALLIFAAFAWVGMMFRRAARPPAV